MALLDIISWLLQVYLTLFFIRSAYRKTVGYERVRAEFQGWGYPYPGLVTRFLSLVWVVSAVAILVPSLVVIASLVLFAFMVIAFLTLVKSGEFARLIQPSRPIAAILVVLAVQYWKT